jgi:hypothetical protein
MSFFFVPSCTSFSGGIIFAGGNTLASNLFSRYSDRDNSHFPESPKSESSICVSALLTAAYKTQFFQNLPFLVERVLGDHEVIEALNAGNQGKGYGASASPKGGDGERAREECL